MSSTGAKSEQISDNDFNKVMSSKRHNCYDKPMKVAQTRSMYLSPGGGDARGGKKLGEKFSFHQLQPTNEVLINVLESEYKSSTD